MELCCPLQLERNSSQLYLARRKKIFLRVPKKPAPKVAPDQVIMNSYSDGKYISLSLIKHKL
jgi:hypothetical protein